MLLIMSLKGKLSLEEIKKNIFEEGFNIHAFPESMKEALKTYELYGKNMDRENMRSYNLRKHEKAMHKEPELNEKLENNHESHLEELNRKIEIGINIDLKEII